jgi:hypothetical protein
VTAPAERARSVASYFKAIAFVFSAGTLFRHVDSEHPKWIMADWPRTDELKQLGLRVAAETPDDTEAVAAIRAAGAKPRECRLAAAWMRSSEYTWEHRNHLRAARLLRATADRSTRLPPPTAMQEALFRDVERLEALPPDQAYALLAAEAPALTTLQNQIVARLSEPDWQDIDRSERVREILGRARQFVGPQAAAGSPLIRSDAASRCAGVHLLGKADLLSADD